MKYYLLKMKNYLEWVKEIFSTSTSTSTVIKISGLSLKTQGGFNWLHGKSVYASADSRKWCFEITLKSLEICSFTMNFYLYSAWEILSRYGISCFMLDRHFTLHCRYLKNLVLHVECTAGWIMLLTSENYSQPPSKLVTFENFFEFNYSTT